GHLRKIHSVLQSYGMGAIVIGLAARYGTREAGEPATVLLPFAADFENVTVGEVRPVTPV
ncbi:hypothetical protein, partial [Pandoraea nosoerga]|uniref:hypothetical protein n=1 Tax=Pandoraea nosoerga TaxID=2508296 RepID=UPI00197E41E9